MCVCGKDPKNACVVELNPKMDRRPLSLVAFYNYSMIFSTAPQKFTKRILTTHLSGQIIATSHDLTPNGGLVREIPLFQGNPGW